MKTISLRQFRDAIPDQSEPVIVQRRDKATGEQVTLGTWTPAIPYADTWARDMTNAASGAHPAGVIYTIVPGTTTSGRTETIRGVAAVKEGAITRPDWPDRMVACDEDCGAFDLPATIEEYRATLTHWESHGILSGCSHGRLDRERAGSLDMELARLRRIEEAARTAMLVIGDMTTVVRMRAGISGPAAVVVALREALDVPPP